MSEYSLLGSKWDAKFACFFLQKLIDSKLLLEESTVVSAMDQLKVLSKHFIKHSFTSNESSGLSLEEEENLEYLWLKMLMYKEKRILPHSIVSVLQNTSKFKICVVYIGTYLMFKTNRRRSDLEFAVNILSLALGTVRDCLGAELIEEAGEILDLASNSIRPRMNDEAVYDFDATPTEKLHLKFLFCCSSLFVYRVFYFFKVNQCSEILTLLASTKQEPIEFNVEQADSLSRLCFNIALKMFNGGEYEGTVIWLKFAHTFGKQVMENGNQINCTEKSLTLLAACYMQVDLANNWPKIIEILDYGDETVLNLELRLQALLFSGKEIPSIEKTVAKYLAQKYQEEDKTSMKKSANELFALLEKNELRTLLVQLLDRIPWNCVQLTDQLNPTNEWLYVKHIKWVCARFAARNFTPENRTERLFSLLQEIQHWDAENGDDSSIYEIMSLSENIALRLANEDGNLESCLLWYEIIVQFANRHGIDSTVVWNTISCLLQLPYDQGHNKAQDLTSIIPEYDLWDDIDPLCIRLQISLVAQDYDKALQILINLEAVTKDDDWEKVQKALCRSASVAKEKTLMIPILGYFEKGLQACQTSLMKAILLRLILRFQMEILRNESPCDRERKEYILQNILRTIETAFLATREARQNENLLIDVRVWFARTAWNFGRLGNKQSAYFRHHLFKLSSQFFALESCWKKEMEIAVIKAVEAAFDFGADRKRIAYVRVLKSALDVVNEFYRFAIGSERIHLINLMEFHALCELKNWQKVKERFDSYLPGDGKDVSAKHDAGFFLNLASIIITTRDAKTREVVTTERGDDTFHRARVSAEQQACLTALAATSLKIAIDLSTTAGNLSPKIILCCRWIVSVLFNSCTIREPLVLWQHFSLLEQLVPWLRSSDFPFAEVHWIFTKIWNSSLLCTNKKFKAHIARWLEESFRPSPHYHNLMKLFKHQLDHVSLSLQ